MLANPDRAHARPDVVVAARPGEECGAAAPSGISARGWRGALRRTFFRVFERRLLGEAAAVAFYALLAVFPAMAALIWLCGLLADPEAAAERLRDMASGALPAGAAEVAGELLGRLAARPGGGFGFGIGAAMLGAALWGGTAAAAQLFGALNAAYGERESRGPVRLYIVALLFALGAAAFVVLALGAVVVPAALGTQAGSGSDALTPCSASAAGRSSSRRFRCSWPWPTGTGRAARARGGAG
jgi:membrane protein